MTSAGVPAVATSVAIIQGSTSQYSYDSDGRSACTCIALTAADIIANNSRATNNSEERTTMMSTEFMNRSIEEGVSRYRTLRHRLNTSSSDVEHMSVDEVLSNDDQAAAARQGQRLFGVRVKSVGEGQRVRQGALSRDIDHPFGLKAIVKGLVDDIRSQLRGNEACGDVDANNKSNCSPSQMIYILLTKTPETVLLCLPSDDDCEHEPQYWLVDSHPRPHLFQGVGNSYAKPHGSMDLLLKSLRDIFPFTDLGPDVPPMMSDMYNMFDLYVVERAT
eukprot:jgi/Psemu1/301942/fgenesh1_kg.52_\